MTAGQAVTVAGLGACTYVGQATYLDDDGREVEHDWLRVVDAAGREAWVPPEDVTMVGQDGGAIAA